MAWIVAMVVVAVGVAVMALLRAQRAKRDAYASSARAELAERQARTAEARTESLADEIRQLARKRIPAAALALSHSSAPVPGLHGAADVDGGPARLLTEAVEAARTAVIEERQRVDAAARAAMRGTAAKIQSLLNQSQQLLHELQHEYDDPRILQLDFRNELALRRTQATAVLCDAWPGLARQSSPLVEVVLGAQSRVAGYERIKIANHLRDERLALVARAAEPLAIALAELLANATAYSHPETDVPVTVQQSGGRGALIVVDDAGIGMDDDALVRARALLAGPEEVLLTELGDPPRTGFAVVGRLVAQYGFSCHIEASPYGGMRTMLRIPAHLLTVVDDDRALSALAPKPMHAYTATTVAPVSGRVAPTRPEPTSSAAPAPAPPTPEPARSSALPSAPPTPEPARSAALPSAPPTPEPARSSALPPAPPTPSEPASASTSAPVPPSARTASTAVPGPDAGRGPAPLPSRRRRQPRTASAPAAERGAAPSAAAPQDPPASRTPEQAGASWTALQQGTLDGRKAGGPATTPGSAAEPDDQGDDAT
ncbi:ATP-binding protein [Streptomyces sp. DT24]|uniref:ATP-binding protein n=1 Tax=Streptomyces sp. DT24 TaxID=3416520 RepID=UPI003CF8DDBB